jgi:hypothetical protein
MSGCYTLVPRSDSAWRAGALGGVRTLCLAALAGTIRAVHPGGDGRFGYSEPRRCPCMVRLQAAMRTGAR